MRGHERDSFLVRHLKAGNRRLLDWAFAHRGLLFTTVTIAAAAAAFAATLLPRAFLPPFNECTLTISLAYNPGISLAESHRLGLVAENLITVCPRWSRSGDARGAPSSTSLPGREILHPVAVSIFGGLISATLLDTFLTPVLFLTFGRKALERIQAGPAGALTPAEAF